MHPMMVSRLAEDRRLDLLAEAAANRRARRPATRHTRPGARRLVGGWLVAVGTWVGGTPEPAPCNA